MNTWHDPRAGQGPSRDEPWYLSTWFVVLMLFLCCSPVGLVLMWMKPSLPRNVKVFVTSAFALLFVAGVVAGAASH